MDVYVVVVESSSEAYERMADAVSEVVYVRNDIDEAEAIELANRVGESGRAS
jgi:hypothetical protein